MTGRPYAYAAGDPVTSVDPSGLIAFCESSNDAQVATGSGDYSLVSFEYTNLGLGTPRLRGYTFERQHRFAETYPASVVSTSIRERQIEFGHSSEGYSIVPTPSGLETVPHDVIKTGGLLANSDNIDDLPSSAVVTQDEDYVFAHLDRFNGIDPSLASKRLHEIKQEEGLGGADNVWLTLSGDVYNPHNGEHIGSLTQGGRGGVA